MSFSPVDPFVTLGSVTYEGSRCVGQCRSPLHRPGTGQGDDLVMAAIAASGQVQVVG